MKHVVCECVYVATITLLVLINSQAVCPAGQQNLVLPRVALIKWGRALKLTSDQKLIQTATSRVTDPLHLQTDAAQPLTQNSQLA